MSNGGIAQMASDIPQIWMEGTEPYREDAKPGEQGFCSATSVPGIIKGNEGSIHGKLTYARILIRRRKHNWLLNAQ